MSDLRNRLIRLAHANPELRAHVLPLIRQSASEWTYHDVEITEGLDGSGNKIYVLQGEKRAKGKRTQYINNQFKSKAEAKNWVEHAMPGATLKKAVTRSYPSPDPDRPLAGLAEKFFDQFGFQLKSKSDALQSAAYSAKEEFQDLLARKDEVDDLWGKELSRWSTSDWRLIRSLFPREFSKIHLHWQNLFG